MSAEAVAYTIFGGLVVQGFVLMVQGIRASRQRSQNHDKVLAVFETNMGYLGRRMDKVESRLDDQNEVIHRLHLAHSASGRLKAVGDSSDA